MQINVWAVQTHRPVALGDQRQRFHRSLPVGSVRHDLVRGGLHRHFRHADAR
jgi:hypothetical protein